MWKVDLALPLYHVVHKAPFKDREFSGAGFSVSQDKPAPSMLLTLLEVALVLSPVGPALMAEAVLLVTEPVALIDGASVRMEVAALAMGLVVEPVATVDVPRVAVDHTAEARRTVTVPVTHKD